MGELAEVNADAARLHIEPYGPMTVPYGVKDTIFAAEADKCYTPSVPWDESVVTKPIWAYLDIESYFRIYIRDKLKDPDLLEAFEIGSALFTLAETSNHSYRRTLLVGHGDSYEYYVYSELYQTRGPGGDYQHYRKELVRHLRSLNLADIIDQIPNNAPCRLCHLEEKNGSWVVDVMASLRGLIRKNYPTVYLSQ